VSTPKPSPPFPQPGPDPRAPQTSEEPPPPAPDHAQSPDRATMDALPPANDEEPRASLKGVQMLKQRVGHRDLAGQRPVPSEFLFPPVADDRASRPRPGPPAPDDEGE